MINSNKYMKPNFELKGSVKGEYQIQVVKADGRVTYPLGKEFIPNLILNSGIDAFFASNRDQGWYGALTTFCRAGSGTTAEAEAQTTLIAQLKSTNSYFGGSGANGTATDTVNGKVTHKRTYEFSTETGAVSYSEIGVGPTASGADLFSRVVLRQDELPITLNLVEGDNLRVVYQLTISIPQIVNATTVSLTTTGWSAAGQLKLTGTFDSIFGTVAANGTYSGGLGLSLMSSRRASSNARASYLATNDAFPAVNANLALASIAQISSETLASYTNGSFTRDITVTFTPADPATSVANVRSVCLRGSGNPGATLQLLLSANQPKSNEYRLSFTFRFTWDRV
jgi:hypothetical protein